MFRCRYFYTLSFKFQTWLRLITSSVWENFRDLTWIFLMTLTEMEFMTGEDSVYKLMLSKLINVSPDLFVIWLRTRGHVLLFQSMTWGIKTGRELLLSWTNHLKKCLLFKELWKNLLVLLTPRTPRKRKISSSGLKEVSEANTWPQEPWMPATSVTSSVWKASSPSVPLLDPRLSSLSTSVLPQVLYKICMYEGSCSD